MNIPLVTEKQILNYCGVKNYQKGKEFLSKHTFYILYKEWMTLKAVCEGTAAPSYSVKVIFDEAGIVYSSCTCYRSNFGPCKHIAGLLSKWHTEPSSFPDRKQLGTKFKKTRKLELIHLLEKIVDLYPELGNKYTPFMGQA
ncbi:hypothetical protein H0X48_04370 [Candidatus Dependentiae bacterium]|nr:hypothetical protein [Candidatus Dependentiae bacterium]